MSVHKYILFTFTESTPALNKTNPPVVVYRWDDESNGEIYTDRSLELTASPIENTDSNEGETTDSSIGLYVVENGKEYPLIPLKERKSMFESANQVK
jgi:hypothetical protein